MYINTQVNRAYCVCVCIIFFICMEIANHHFGVFQWWWHMPHICVFSFESKQNNKNCLSCEEGTEEKTTKFIHRLNNKIGNINNKKRDSFFNR